MSERKLRRRRQIEIGAGIVHSGLVGAAGRKLIVEYRDLPNIARPAHGQSASWVECSRQNIGDRVSGLMPKKPRRQHRVSAFEQPWRGQRTTRRERHDDRLAEGKYR